MAKPTDEVLLTTEDVVKRYGVGKRAIWRRTRDKGFPKPVKQPPVNTWRESDLDAWDKQVEAKRGDR